MEGEKDCLISHGRLDVNGLVPVSHTSLFVFPVCVVVWLP